MQFNYATGKPITPKQRKAAVIAATGWTDEEYRKNYNVWFNKHKNYETLTGRTLTSTPAESFAVHAIGRAKYGESYKAPAYILGIESTTAETTTKSKQRGVKKALREFETTTGRKATESERERIAEDAAPVAPKAKDAEHDFRRVSLLSVLKNYSALIAKSKKARALVESYGVKVGNVVKGTRTRVRKENGAYTNETYDYIESFDVSKVDLDKWQEIRNELEGITATGPSGFTRRASD